MLQQVLRKWKYITNGTDQLFLKEMDIAFKKHIKTSCRQAAFVWDERYLSAGTEIPAINVVGFAVTLRGRIQGLRRAEVTFWKRHVRYVGWGVAGEPNLRASMLIFWMLETKLVGLYKMPTGLKELFGKAFKALDKSQCLQNQNLKIITSNVSETDSKKKKGKKREVLACWGDPSIRSTSRHRMSSWAPLRWSALC